MVNSNGGYYATLYVGSIGGIQSVYNAKDAAIRGCNIINMDYDCKK